MRAFAPLEIKLLRANNQKNQGTIFEESDFVALAEGTASFKAFSRADKIIAEEKRRMNLPPSRLEVFQTYTHKSEFGQLSDRLFFLTKTLIKAGVVTEEMITETAKEAIAEFKKSQEVQSANKEEVKEA